MNFPILPYDPVLEQNHSMYTVVWMGEVAVVQTQRTGNFSNSRGRGQEMPNRIANIENTLKICGK
ncbi:MAG: hypothetical protein HBSAPP01_07560 [Candidatus Brocadia sapporoensis]|nr:MAG: hypothetical protein HBSAPP01_07560 [Candidatus Brocadia sapporoensis]